LETAFCNNIKTIVFDLDGTLYQSERYYADYLRLMIASSRWESAYDDLLKCIEQVFFGKRLHMNAAYRLEKVEADTAEELFKKLEGQIVTDIEFEELIGNTRYEFLGDGWSVMKLVGTAMGLLDGDRGDMIYLQTRDLMLKSKLISSERLADTLKKLRTCYRTVLISNATKPLADEVLSAIGCSDSFASAVYGAHKPVGLTDALKKLDCSDAFEHPETILTVGDHALNDLYPLGRIGSKTLWINPFHDIQEPHSDAEVRSMEELVDFLEQIYRQKAVRENNDTKTKQIGGKEQQ